MATLIPLANVEPDMIEQLLDRAFGPDRHARTAYRIREGTQWLETMSFAALDEDEMLVGTIQCWPVALHTPDGARVPMVMIGPVAVVPERQNEGYGKALMMAMLDAQARLAASSGGAYPQVMIGDPDYYGRWGFTARHTGNWHTPGPVERERLLLRSAISDVLPEEGMLAPWETAEDTGLAN